MLKAINLMSMVTCQEIIKTQQDKEAKYAEQLAAYEAKLKENEEIKALDPKRTLKVPKEPFPPQHNYTQIALAHEHIKVNKLVCEIKLQLSQGPCRIEDIIDEVRELERMGYIKGSDYVAYMLWIDGVELCQTNNKLILAV